MNKFNEKQVLELTIDEIKGFDLNSLKNIWPIYEAKEKEVLLKFEKIQSKKNKTDYTRNGLQIKMSDLNHSLHKQELIFKDLIKRRKDAMQEFHKVTTMCTYYQQQISNFLNEVNVASGTHINQKSKGPKTPLMGPHPFLKNKSVKSSQLESCDANFLKFNKKLSSIKDLHISK
ncbi:hypothetical protein ABEB36_003033 [Hypothenemus hampei]|uniref:Uncharacterized protein n=1 Tax=Hypothenemus hampei TaxID=57062 RepID=A0ABD1F7S3_HYPHA